MRRSMHEIVNRRARTARSIADPKRLTARDLAIE
jgi:hypothetical protein